MIHRNECDSYYSSGLGTEWKIDGKSTEGRFSIVHRTIAPRTLAAPLHLHHNEDEFSYVLSGTLGALLSDDVVAADPGTWVVKPRRQWHTLWNAGDVICELIEVISPAGFENYFRELAVMWRDPEQITRINTKYSLETRLDSVPDLCRRFGLAFPELQIRDSQ